MPQYDENADLSQQLVGLKAAYCRVVKDAQMIEIESGRARDEATFANERLQLIKGERSAI